MAQVVGTGRAIRLHHVAEGGPRYPEDDDRLSKQVHAIEGAEQLAVAVRQFPSQLPFGGGDVRFARRRTAPDQALGKSGGRLAKGLEVKRPSDAPAVGQDRGRLLLGQAARQLDAARAQSRGQPR